MSGPLIRCTILSWLAACTLSLAADATPLDSLVNQTVDKIVQLGFPRQNIAVKPAKQGQLDMVLIRCVSQRRVYDLTLLSAKQAYFAVSYDLGRHFGRTSQFSQIDVMLRMLKNIERRESQRDGFKPLSSTDLQQQRAALANDQTAGLNEAKSKAKRDKQRQREEAAAKASTGDKLAKAAQGLNGGTLSGGEMAQTTQKAASPLAGANAACQEQGALGDNAQGGLNQAATQIGEAALVSLLGGGLGDTTELGKAENSAYFSGSENPNDLDANLGDTAEFAKRNLHERGDFLRRLFTALVTEKEAESVQRYSTLQQQWVRFKTWGNSEGIAAAQLTTEALQLIDTLTLEPESFATFEQFVPKLQHRSSYYVVQPVSLLLDPTLSSTEAAGIAYFFSQRAFSKAQQLKLAKPTMELIELNRRLTTITSQDAATMLAAYQKLGATLTPLLAQLNAFLNDSPSDANFSAPRTTLTAPQYRGIMQRLRTLPLPTSLSADAWLMTPHPTAKIDGYQIWQARHLGLLPPVIWNVATKTADKTVDVEILDSEKHDGWNRLARSMKWEWNPKSIPQFPVLWLSLVAPDELPKWHFQKDELKPLIASTQALLQEGWGYQQNSDGLRLRFFSQASFSNRITQWELTVNPAGEVVQMNQHSVVE